MSADDNYNSHAYIYVTNNTGGTATIHLSHRYSTDPTQQITWPNVPSGANTPTSLYVGYNTGFLRTGMDYWWIGVEISDGPNPGNYACEGSADDPTKECFLQSEDNGKNLYCPVSTQVFVIDELSGPCSTSMYKVDTVSSAKGEKAGSKK